MCAAEQPTLIDDWTRRRFWEHLDDSWLTMTEWQESTCWDDLRTPGLDRLKWKQTPLEAKQNQKYNSLYMGTKNFKTSPLLSLCIAVILWTLTCRSRLYAFFATAWFYWPNSLECFHNGTNLPTKQEKVQIKALIWNMKNKAMKWTSHWRSKRPGKGESKRTSQNFRSNLSLPSFTLL